MTKTVAMWCGLILSMSTGIAIAADPPADAATTQAEIDYLFSHLQESGCRFNRNGTWYDAAHASEHLRGKYDYLARGNAIADTEDFIDKAASFSSMSGQPYQVQCGDAPAQTSATWFHDALDHYRQHAH